MAFNNKWVAFGVGVVAGAAIVSIVKTPAFKKACALLSEKGFSSRMTLPLSLSL